MIDLEQYPLFAENKATLKQTSMDDSIKDEIQYIEYYGSNVPLFRRNGYRQSGTMIP